MRSEEVEEAINQLKEDVNIIIYGNQIFEDRTTCEKDDLKTVLSYIEELEKKIERFNNELDLDYVDNNFVSKDKIRDKIKELEEKYVELSKNKSSSEKAELNHEYIEKRSLLESLLGE